MKYEVIINGKHFVTVESDSKEKIQEVLNKFHFNDGFISCDIKETK